MSLSNTVVKATLAGDGANTTFAIPFAIISDGDTETKVYLRDESVSPPTQTLQTLTTHYTLTGGPPATDVEFVTAPAATDKVVIIRQLVLNQPESYVGTGPFPAATHELALDRMAAQIQQLNEVLSRTPKMQVTEQNIDLQMAEPIATQLLQWNATGDGLVNIDLATVIDSTVFSGKLEDLITLSGVAANATDLGTFTGATISDNVTEKVALQELETKAELNATNIGTNVTNIGTNTTNIGTNTTNIGTNTTAIGLNTAKVSADGSIDTHSDVDTTTSAPSTGEHLEWNGSNWVPGAAGGGGGGGGINFLSGTNVDAETSIGDWVEYDDGAVAAPVDGLGGTAANITLGRNVVTAEILRGTASFEIVKGAADAQGEGVSIPFSIDQFDQGKEIFVKLKYRNDTNYASGDIKAYIYDVTNATLIGALRNDDNGDFISHTGQGTSYLGAFSAASDSISYRLIFHITSANALAYDFRFDSVEVSPDSVVPGFIGTEFVDITTEANASYLPTGVGAGLGTFSYYTTARVGDQIHIKFEYAHTATPGSGGSAVTFPLPYGLTQKLLEQNAGTALTFNVDHNITQISGADGYTNTNFALNGSSGLNLRRLGTGSTITGAHLLASCTIQAEIRVITNEYKASAMISTAENLFSTATVRGESNGGEALTADVTNITFTETEDLTGSWDGQIFTAPRTQEYTIFGGVRFTVAGSRGISAYINGTISKLLQTNLSSTLVHISGQLKLNKGYQLSFRSDSAGTLSANANTHYIVIQGRPDLSRASVFGESELVESSSGSQVTYPITASQFGDLTSIVLTPGEWEIVAMQSVLRLAANASASRLSLGISTTPGNSASGLLNGVNKHIGQFLGAASGDYTTQTIPSYSVTISTNTTYYLKSKLETSITSVDLAGFRISARRIK